MQHRISIDKTSESGLRNQIVFEVSRLVLDGLMPLGAKLPSFRRLSKELEISINTVVCAYHKLEADGLIVARPRSGYFVSAKPSELATIVPTNDSLKPTPKAPIENRLNRNLCAEDVATISRPKDWHKFKFPFVCNQVDDDRFPVAKWRECTRLAMNRKDLKIWSGDSQFSDSQDLIEQVCHRILPRRGLFPNPTDTMITLGSQNGLFITAMLFGGPTKCCAIEDPGFPEARKIFQSSFERVIHIPLDDEGLVVDERLQHVDLVYVTPNRQFPTTITMSEQRRKTLLEAAEKYDFYIIEDDYECDVDYRFAPPLPLRQLDDAGRVIYLASLSKGLSPGLRLGYMNGPAAFIDSARCYRGMMLRHAPGVLQQTAALFLKFGHYDSLLRKNNLIFEQRWQIANSVIEHLFQEFEIQGEYGGTNFVLTDPNSEIDLEDILERALTREVVIERMDPCFSDPDRGKFSFRIGVSSIGRDRIESGLHLLADAIAESRAIQASSIPK